MGSTGKSRAICLAVFAFWRCARVRLNMVLFVCGAELGPARVPFALCGSDARVLEQPYA